MVGRSGPPCPPRQPLRPAYTMIELSLVLAIMAVMAAIALPRMAASATSGRIDGAAASAASLLRTARQMAIATSTTVHVTFQSGGVLIAVVDPSTHASADVSDLLPSQLPADRIISIGAGVAAVSDPPEDRERARARRAALLALQEETGAVSKQDSSGTTSRNTLPWGAVVVSADFGGDWSVVFNGHGVPDSGGSAVIQVGAQQRRITVQAQTGQVEVTR